MARSKKYLVVYDVEGDVHLAIARLTNDQAEEAQCLSAVSNLIELSNVNNLGGMSAEEVLSLRTEFDEEE